MLESSVCFDQSCSDKYLFTVGNCNDTVMCGSQPIIEIQDKATNKPITNIGWRDRIWTVTMAVLGNATVMSRVTIPKTGRVLFHGVTFYDVTRNIRLQFTLTTSPSSQRYSNMTAISNRFDVKPRTFYLSIIEQPGLANASAVFGQQPIVEVRDEGTRARATPLKTTWQISVSIFSNPKPDKVVLMGQLSVPVNQERARFSGLLISEYGQYKLQFTSNHGHTVLSRKFQVSNQSFRILFSRLLPCVLIVVLACLPRCYDTKSILTDCMVFLGAIYQRLFSSVPAKQHNPYSIHI